jgi:transposase
LEKQLLAHADLAFAQEREATADQARLAELEQMVGRLTVELEAAKKASQLLSLPSKRSRR